MTSSVIKKKIKYQQSLLIEITLVKKVNICRKSALKNWDAPQNKKLILLVDILSRKYICVYGDAIPLNAF